MTLEDKNQNDILNDNSKNSLDIEYVFSDKTINRFKIKPKVEDISIKLKELKELIKLK